MFFAQAL